MSSLRLLKKFAERFTLCVQPLPAGKFALTRNLAMDGVIVNKWLQGFLDSIGSHHLKEIIGYQENA